jgi:hypothetical protein
MSPAKKSTTAAPAAKPATKTAAAPAASAKPAVAAANLAKKRVQKGKHLQRSRKVRTEVRFRRPKTLSLPRNPRYQRKSAPHRNRYDYKMSNDRILPTKDYDANYFLNIIVNSMSIYVYSYCLNLMV